MYKVLLVDDEPIAIEGLEMLINWAEYGFHIEAACNNGEDAMNHIRNYKPDLVVTDIQMPVLNGLELIEQTRTMGNHSTMFVITSGYNNFDYAKRAIRLGVSHYLTKPINSKEANAVLLQLQETLEERERQHLIKASADRCATKRALSRLLFNRVEKERFEAKELLQRVAGQVDEWICMQLIADAESLGNAREAAHQFSVQQDLCYLIDGDKDELGLIIGLQTYGESADRQGRIYEYADRLLQTVKNRVHGKVGIAVGSSASSLDELFMSWESAEEAGRFLFFSETEIVLCEDIQVSRFSNDSSFLKAADSIIEMLESGDEGDLELSIHEAYCNFKSNRTIPELVSIFCTQVMMRCAAVYKELGGNPDELLVGFGQRLSASGNGNLYEMAVALTSFCLKSQKAIRLLQEKNTGGTAVKVAEFLNQNYRDPLTIKDIAERFYMNPVYLGQLFAKKYGKGIVDYIHDLRMEEAKQQLVETDQALYIIGEKLGYSSYQYFMKQFEKRVLMKPADYRSHYKTT
ncbi:response regulator [Paenibacillus lupini]|uniref:response regulator transcription factor n=1 Tax=Paenibacillus lupini TaxID=1450204 RepID=UPI0014206421|nr:response regulator [Paenibacillus lupini]NIK22069.1 two-component system response regulator YesN [Paenibacillus lupini]